MPNPRVFVLTIFYPSWLSEPDRSITHTILRRRSDGPLLVRERDPGTAQRARKDWGNLRYTSGRHHSQAVFTDLHVLAHVQAELQAFVPDLPAGVVRLERRRRYRPDPPCTCVLPRPKAARPEGDAVAPSPFPAYTQVSACPRHAQLLPKPGTQTLGDLVQRQVLDQFQDRPRRAITGGPLILDELLALRRRSGEARAAEHLVAELAHEGRKFALYG